MSCEVFSWYVSSTESRCMGDQGRAILSHPPFCMTSRNMRQVLDACFLADASCPVSDTSPYTPHTPYLPTAALNLLQDAGNATPNGNDKQAQRIVSPPPSPVPSPQAHDFARLAQPVPRPIDGGLRDALIARSSPFSPSPAAFISIEAIGVSIPSQSITIPAISTITVVVIVHIAAVAGASSPGDASRSTVAGNKGLRDSDAASEGV